MAPGTVQTASVGDNTPGVTTLTTGPAKYDPSILKLTIPGINFNLSCPTGLHVTWTSQQPTAQAQQTVSAQGELPTHGCCSKIDCAENTEAHIYKHDGDVIHLAASRRMGVCPSRSVSRNWILCHYRMASY
jgi:hypothetical protein